MKAPGTQLARKHFYLFLCIKSKDLFLGSLCPLISPWHLILLTSISLNLSSGFHVITLYKFQFYPNIHFHFQVNNTGLSFWPYRHTLFHCDLLYCASQIFCFWQILKVCGNCAVSDFYCPLCVSGPWFGNSCATSSF